MNRKISFPSAMIFATYILVACGGGGDGGTQVSSDELLGTVVLRIQVDESLSSNAQSEGLQPFVGKISAATNGILIRAWDDAGHDVLKEFPITTGSTEFTVIIPLPGGTNYRLDAIAYGKNTYKSILTVGRSAPFEIIANARTNVSLTLDSYQVDFTGTTTEVTGGEPFNIQVKITGPDFFTQREDLITPLISSAYLYAAFITWSVDGTSPFPGVFNGTIIPNRNKFTNSNGTATYVLSITANAPTVQSVETLYYQISFWAVNSYRTDNIPFLFVPSLKAGESLGQITINPPTGGIIINLN